MITTIGHTPAEHPWPKTAGTTPCYTSTRSTTSTTATYTASTSLTAGFTTSAAPAAAASNSSSARSGPLPLAGTIGVAISNCVINLSRKSRPSSTCSSPGGPDRDHRRRRRRRARPRTARRTRQLRRLHRRSADLRGVPRWARRREFANIEITPTHQVAACGMHSAIIRATRPATCAKQLPAAGTSTSATSTAPASVPTAHAAAHCDLVRPRPDADADVFASRGYRRPWSARAASVAARRSSPWR